MKLAVVILNFNGLENTLECLESVRRCASGPNKVEIIVVDNNSQDGSQEALAKLKDIHLIQNTDNIGYSGGNNVGIKKALERKADAVIILNNDTSVDKNLILKLAAVLKSADIASPKIYFAKGFEFHKNRYKGDQLGRVIWYAGARIDWDNIIGTHIGVDEVDVGQLDRRAEIDLATGACMIVKREVFEKIGAFDEKYFLYLEDMDFCVRARRANFKIVYAPKAILWHKNAGAIGSGSALQDYYFTRNRLRFAAKYAKIRTKIAVAKQILGSVANPIKRKALFDFLTFNFGRANI
ncbi:glycosyltransferase family 2 protein [Candidatus Curtissbacteria bacterium]|nr:glycosyltransferase family 2 protein [Candidatus Curtissbacteria bacterium]